MSKKAALAAERQEAIATLRRMLKPGDTVYTILRHCSSSGMFRVIDLVIPYREALTEYPLIPEHAKPVVEWRRDYSAKPRHIAGKTRIRSIGWIAARAMGDKYDSDRGGIKIGGCGMDMGFSLVYSLGHALWPKGTSKPHSVRNGEPDTNGGYALRHEWL